VGVDTAFVLVADVWRYREYDADAYAAPLGCADDLAQYLLEQQLILDTPVPHLLLIRQHPPVALRIDRLRRAAECVFVSSNEEEEELNVPLPPPVELDPVSVDQSMPAASISPPQRPPLIERLKVDFARRWEELRPLVEEARRLEEELASLKSMQRVAR
jgi:hypothetical protein